MTDPVRVLLVEDSATQRKALSAFLSRAEGLELVGQAENGQQAVELTSALRPDVLLMDVRMPGLDGLAATSKIMRKCATPILLMTAPGNMDSEVNLGLQALEAGALDLIPKPDLGPGSAGCADDLIDRLKLLAKVPVIAHMRGSSHHREQRQSTGYYRRAAQVVGIVASTGGPRALQVVLSELPPTLKAAVAVVQHLDATFMSGLVQWLDHHCQLPVCQPSHNEELKQGVIYICPPGRYAEVTEARRIELISGPIPPGGHCPSGDRLLASLADSYGSQALGVVLTGMGADGAKGLLAIRSASGATIAQDEESSVIYGMPREATINGAAKRVLPLDKIARAIVGAVG